MSPFEEAKSKPENRARIPHLEEHIKRQKCEWLKRHQEEKRKQKHELKKACRKQGVPCISEPVPVHKVVLPQGEENVIDNIFTEYVAETDLLLLGGSRMQTDEKQDKASSIACVGAWTIPPTWQATRKTVFSQTSKQGKNLVTLSKLKRQRPEVSNHNPPVFIKLSAVVHENVARITLWRNLKPPTVRKINTS